MAGTDRRKQSIYFSETMLDELKVHAARCDRSISWVMQQAWKIARSQIMAAPSANDAPESGGAPTLRDGLEK